MRSFLALSANKIYNKIPNIWFQLPTYKTVSPKNCGVKLVRTPLNVYFTAFKSIFLSLYAPITSYEHAGHTRKASRISKTVVENCGKGVGNFYLS